VQKKSLGGAGRHDAMRCDVVVVVVVSCWLQQATAMSAHPLEALLTCEQAAKGTGPRLGGIFQGPDGRGPSQLSRWYFGREERMGPGSACRAGS
jgi:hypothetical protein